MVKTFLASIVLILTGFFVPVSGQSTNNVRIQLVDGSSLRGELESIDGEGKIVGKGLPASLTVDKITQLKTTAPLSKANHDVTIFVVGDSRILANKVSVENDKVSFESSSGISQLPLELVQGLVWKDNAKVQQQFAEAATDRDQVIVTTGRGQRVVDGVLETVSPDLISLKFKGEVKTISFANVQVDAIVVANLDLKKPEGAVARMTLTDGSRINGRLAGIADGVVRLEVPGRNFIDLPYAKLSGFEIKSDNLVYLSDLTPLELEQETIFTLQRELQKDLSIAGNPIRLKFASTEKVLEFEKGIGAQSYSRIVFANEGFDRFRALAGIDAETRGRGDCKMSVVGDGIELWSSRIRASADPAPISVDISGMKKIALIVEPGEQFDLADHANWCEARFTKQK